MLTSIGPKNKVSVSEGRGGGNSILLYKSITGMCRWNRGTFHAITRLYDKIWILEQNYMNSATL